MKKSKKAKREQEQIIKEKINARGKINLIFFENFQKKCGIEFNELFDIFKYKSEDEIISKYESNVEESKYFNVIFLNHENPEDAFTFLKSFVKNVEENGIAKNNSDYPFFVFFENKNFNKKILYSYYLKNIGEISRFYDIKSHNIFFVKNVKEEIEELISKDFTNYYYEFDFKKEDNGFIYNIEMLFMGQTGCGKSTFINYLLGKLRAYSASMNNFKSLGGIYSHTKYPICIKDSEGFEVNSAEQQQKIFEILNKNIEEELNNRTHVAFYLIPGPFNSNRDLDYSCISSLIKLEQYNIHYYLIMTKDPEEGENFGKVSLRFLNRIIKKNDYNKITTNLSQNELTDILQKIKNKLSNRIFSVDVSKRESITIKLLLQQIYNDLKVEKENNEKFIKEISNKKEKGSNFTIDFSGSKITNDKGNFEIPPELEKSPFFNFNKFKNDDIRKRRAKQVIEEAKNVSSIRKLFFCYNSKIRDNRKKMLRKILDLYECKNLTIDLLEGQLSSKEKDEWFYQHDCTDELGNKIIDICEEEFKKSNVIDNYIGYCVRFNESIDKFGLYVNEFINFNLDGQKIPYDCELNVN